MGNKYALLENLHMYFPKECGLFIDLFGGGGVVTINSKYKNNIYNELNKNIYNLFNMLINLSHHIILSHIFKRIKEFDLLIYDTSEKTKGDDLELRKGEKEFYNFRTFYNESDKNVIDLFLLSFYSFNNLYRFNRKGEFNMPYGNRKFLPEEHSNEIKDFKRIIKDKNITTLNKNAFDILKDIKNNKENIFIYLDPPYLNTVATYNEVRDLDGWTIDDDYKLFDELDRLHKLGVKWAMSNVLWTKGIHNKHLEQWANEKGYNIITFEEKKYSAGNSKNQDLYTEEILIINYKAPFERYDIFDFIDE